MTGIKLNDMSIYLDQIIMLHRRDRLANINFRAGVKGFYEYLKPYMIEWIQTDTAYNKEDYVKLIEGMNYYSYRPSDFNTAEAKVVLVLLWQFCKDYGFTIIRPPRTDLKR